MKNYYMITNEATRYYKKAIKRDKVMVANSNGSIYIVNGYCAFRFPAVVPVWDIIARPAFMVDMPADNTGFQFVNGERCSISANEVSSLFHSVTQNIFSTAVRTPFLYDAPNCVVRLYKNQDGVLTSVNTTFDSMVDFSHVASIKCKGMYSPVVCADVDNMFVAVLLPIRPPSNFDNLINATFPDVKC